MTFRMDYGGGPPHRWRGWLQRHLDRLRRGAGGPGPGAADPNDGLDPGAANPNAGLDPGAIGEGPGAAPRPMPVTGPGGARGDDAAAHAVDPRVAACARGGISPNADGVDGPNALVQTRKARRRAIAAVARGGHGPGWVLYWIRRYRGLSATFAVLTVLALILPGGRDPLYRPLPDAGLMLLVDPSPPGQADILPLPLPDGVDLVARDGLRLTARGTVEPGGAVRSSAGQYYLDTGPETPVVPVVRPAGNPGLLLADSTAQRRAARELADLAVRRGYAGYHLDFGPLAAEPGFAALTDAVAARLHRNGHTLAVSLWPDEVPAQTAGRLARAPGLVVLQAHRPRPFAAAPAPIAPLDWVDRQVRAALAGARPEQVVLGVGAYGYDWSDGAEGIRRLTLEQVHDLARRHGARPAEGPDGGLFTYSSGGVRHTVWYECAASAAAKARLARLYRLRGVAVWQPGAADGALWSQLSAAWRAGR